MKKTFAYRIITFLAVVTIAGTLAGCGNSETLTGKYYNVSPSGEVYDNFYVEFNPDGKSNKMIMYGSEIGEIPFDYIIDGDSINMQFFSGADAEFKCLTNSFSHKGNSVFINEVEYRKE